MNIETANKLVELRKKSNLSQEELANRLGISRQAVSKWERAEAAPDTDNLIKLARLYKISLDDLLLSDIDLMKEVDREIEESKEKGFNETRELDLNDEGITITKGEKKVYISNRGVNINTQNLSKVTVIKKTSRTIIASLCTIGFFIFGFLTKRWSIAWLFFLGIPILESIVIMIYTKKIKYFNYPVFVTLIFFLLGFIFHIWAYAWVIFLTIPLFYSLVGGFKSTIYLN